MIELSAPAKVNLSLHVLCRREDGYHELFTRMQKVNLCDHLVLTFSERPGVELTCNEESLSGGRNLATIAARKFLDAAPGFPAPGVTIRLTKKIPIAAGLGGGSSDAGAVLRGLNSLLEEPVSESRLLDLAVTIGADVPFFAVEYTAALATGIGEHLQPVSDCEDFWILLVNPGFSVSTRSVFENYALTTVSKDSKLASFQNDSACSFSIDQLHNDLEPVTVSAHPVIESIKTSLVEAGASAAMMSGSGPTVFGLFSTAGFDEQRISELVKQFSSVYGRQVFATRAYAGA